MSLLYQYSKETIGIINSLVQRTQMPVLPEVVYHTPLQGIITLQSGKESRYHQITITENEQSKTYIIFDISRASDMVKQFRVTGDLATNTKRILLVAGRQIISSSDDIKTPIGDSWFPICAMPYQCLSVYCELSDENGLKNGTIEYSDCLLPNKERAELVKISRIYPVGYDIVIFKGGPIGDTVDETYGYKIVDFLRKEHPFNDKNSVCKFPLTGRIKLNERQGAFRRFGRAFDNILVKANKNCEFILTANDMVIYKQAVEANTETKIVPETFFVYASYNEISFEFTPDDGYVKDLSCSVERSESFLESSIDKLPYFIPELNLVVFEGAYLTSQCYAGMVSSRKNNKPVSLESEIV